MDPQRARELLAAERARVERAIQQISGVGPTADDDEHLDQHIADQATELYDKEFDAGHLEDLRERLSAIERAEKRLAAGTYGLSIESGKPIPDARLEAVPWAERTVEEQERYERGGGV